MCHGSVWQAAGAAGQQAIRHTHACMHTSSNMEAKASLDWAQIGMPPTVAMEVPGGT